MVRMSKQAMILSALIGSCDGMLVCANTPLNLGAEYTVTPQTQGHAIAIASGLVGTGNFLHGYGPFEVAMRRVMRKSVGDQVARDIEASCADYAGQTLEKMAGQTVLAVFGADAIVGAAAGAGMALLINHIWHWNDYHQLTKNAQLDVDSLLDAYENLFRAFLDFPHPIENLQGDSTVLCRWKEAAAQMNDKVLRAQTAIRKDKAYYDDCWVMCGTRIPTVVITDIARVESKMEDMNLVLDGFLDCYPSCLNSDMDSSWAHIADDAFDICEGVHKTMCDFPGNQQWCASATHHHCKKWSSATGTAIITAAQQEATGTAPMLPPVIQNAVVLPSIAGSCDGTLHAANDVEQLVRCTQALLTSKGRAVDELKQQLSSNFHMAAMVAMVAWAGIVWESGRRRHAIGNEYQDYGDKDTYDAVWDAAAKYLPPLMLSLSMLACGVAIASKWAADSEGDKIGEVSLWMNTILDDLKDLNDLLASNPQGWALNNFSVLASDVSTSIATAIHGQPVADV